MVVPAPTMYHRWLGWHAPAMRRVGVAAGAGVVVGAAVAAVAGWELGLVCGWDATALMFVAVVGHVILRADAGKTAKLAVQEDVNRDLARVLLLAASTVSLGAVGLVLRSAGDETGTDRIVLVTVAALTIVVSWTVVNTVFTLRYADLYYSAPAVGLVDFGGTDAEREPPEYRDFAYLAFTVGMTYQVSDTNLRNRALRRAVLAHALFAYLYGVVIVSTVVNIVAGLLR